MRFLVTIEKNKKKREKEIEKNARYLKNMMMALFSNMVTIETSKLLRPMLKLLQLLEKFFLQQIVVLRQ
jgi:hypothetical protein